MFSFFRLFINFCSFIFRAFLMDYGLLDRFYVTRNRRLCNRSDDVRNAISNCYDRECSKERLSSEMRYICAIRCEAFCERSSGQGNNINYGCSQRYDNRSNDHSSCLSTASNDFFHGFLCFDEDTIDQRNVRFGQSLRFVRRLYNLFRCQGIEDATRGSACG